MSRLRVKVVGGRRIVIQFDALSKAVGQTVLTQAALLGMAPIRDAARINAPLRSGNLKREIQARVVRTDKNTVEVGVSWRRGRASRTSAFYGLFVHEGTGERVRKKGGGGRTGRMRSNPFLVRAFDERKGEADRITRRVFSSALRRAVARG